MGEGGHYGLQAARNITLHFACSLPDCKQFNPPFARFVLFVSLEGIMDFASLFDTLNTNWGDEILVWAVAAVAGCICLVAVVNVLDMFLDNNEMG